MKKILMVLFTTLTLLTATMFAHAGDSGSEGVSSNGTFFVELDHYFDVNSGDTGLGMANLGVAVTLLDNVVFTGTVGTPIGYSDVRRDDGTYWKQTDVVFGVGVRFNFGHF